ncbi:hypothetical protein ACWC0A_23050 [Streptomyces scopuliridis]
MNSDITRIRTDQEERSRNILASAHGSVLEHAGFFFILHNASYDWANSRSGFLNGDQDAELMERAIALLDRMEALSAG